MQKQQDDYRAKSDRYLNITNGRVVRSSTTSFRKEESLGIRAVSVLEIDHDIYLFPIVYFLGRYKRVLFL
jgi:hypothetical protein